MSFLFLVLVAFQVLFATGVHGAEGAHVAGAYVFGHEVRSFQPCRSSKTYWVKPVNPELGDRLREHHRELATEPYGRIYVVVSGGPGDDKTDGFAQSYDGYFEISEVLDASGRIPLECAIH